MPIAIGYYSSYGSDRTTFFATTTEDHVELVNSSHMTLRTEHKRLTCNLYCEDSWLTPAPPCFVYIYIDASYEEACVLADWVVAIWTDLNADKIAVDTEYMVTALGKIEYASM